MEKMKKVELITLKAEKETLKEKLQATYHQVCGQLILIDELLSKIQDEEAQQPK